MVRRYLHLNLGREPAIKVTTEVEEQYEEYMERITQRDIDSYRNNEYSVIFELVASNPEFFSSKVTTLAREVEQEPDTYRDYFAPHLGGVVRKNVVPRTGETELWFETLYHKHGGGTTGGQARATRQFQLPLDSEITVIPIDDILLGETGHGVIIEFGNFNNFKRDVFKGYRQEEAAIYTHATDFIAIWSIISTGTMGSPPKDKEIESTGMDSGVFVEEFDFSDPKYSDMPFEWGDYTSRTKSMMGRSFFPSDYISYDMQAVFVFDQAEIARLHGKVKNYEHKLLPQQKMSSPALRNIIVSKHQQKLLFNAIEKWYPE